MIDLFCRVGKGASATCPPSELENRWARFALPTLRFTVVIFAFCFISFTTFAVPVVDVTQDSATEQPLVQDQSSNSNAPTFNTKGLSFEQRLTRLEQIAAQQAQTQAMIAQLQQQVEHLQGANDVMRHELETLRNQQQTFYKDLNARLIVLEKPATPAVVTPVAAVPAASTPSTPSAEQTAYQQSYNLIAAQKYDQAIAGLQAFVKQYPNSTLVPSALYWQGEVLLVQAKPAQARTLFTQIVKNYPKSNKAAAAQTELDKMVPKTTNTK